MRGHDVDMKLRRVDTRVAPCRGLKVFVLEGHGMDDAIEIHGEGDMLALAGFGIALVASHQDFPAFCSGIIQIRLDLCDGRFVDQ